MLLKLDQVSLAFGSRPLLDHATLQVEQGERVCIVGRNGEGKSSLLRLVSGAMQPDSGAVWTRPGARIAFLVQDIAVVEDERVADVVAGGLPEAARIRREFAAATEEYARTHDEALSRRIATLQHELEAVGGWQMELRIETVMTRLGLDADARFDASVRRLASARVAGARAGVLIRTCCCSTSRPIISTSRPSTGWKSSCSTIGGALLFVSHDRRFVNRLATRIIELDRGR